MAEPIPKCFTFLIDVLRKSASGGNKLHDLVWDCKYDKKNGYAIKGSESKRWLRLARSTITDGGLDDAGFFYGFQPRTFLRTWISKHVSGPIAEDVNRCILKLENHSGHLRYLIRRVKSGAGSNWEGEKLRRVIYYWYGREFEIKAELFELLKSIDFAMGWGTNKTNIPLWDGYEKHHQADADHTDDGVIDAIARSMVWGDDKFDDIPARGIKVLDLLLKAYRDGNRVVTLGEIQSLEVSVDGGMVNQVFKVKRKRHPVSKIIEDLRGGRYRLKPPRKNT
jgi:hypothetical protein